MSKPIALVTGVGRMNGIGKAICVELAKGGADIFFTYWNSYDRQMPWGVPPNDPELIQKEIESLGVRCARLELDLSQTSSIARLFDEIEQALGTPQILINNATYSTNTPLATLTATELDQHYAVNFRAVALLIAEFVKRFHGNQGRIINLSSGQSLGAMNNEIAYAMTKGAVETLTQTLQHELAYQRITINAVNPGLTDSGWMDEESKGIFRDRFPMGRFGVPTDAARLIAFLASEKAEWITGQIIHSEGGFIRDK